MTDLRTPDEWSVDFNIVVLDPDGWRADGKPWSDPIPRDEFSRRAIESTIRADLPAWKELSTAQN